MDGGASASWKAAANWGLSAVQKNALGAEQLARRSRAVRERFHSVGAHFVVQSLGELPELVDTINGLLRAGVRPWSRI